ncbi:hypothetical protein L9F63_015543 [Diploptera punctata]|uniref:Methylated-DNA--protein-cysteine methyltransferase n=1 Tax=Diploptera punctata TaxID=6984 RepID=A0AAD8EJD1_DIPPU|nr:hypothetical protein L9F63_015543 [Diploptera punctata]
MCPDGIHYLNQMKEISDENFTPKVELGVTLIGSTPFEDEKVKRNVDQCIFWLTEYFKDPHKIVNTMKPDICDASENGTFQERVWLCLAKNIGPGQTVSYGQLAKMVKSSGASQAVGTAMATNPIQILVPCHRVIRSDGTLGQYSRGKRNNVKLWLLEHEGLKVINNKVMS